MRLPQKGTKDAKKKSYFVLFAPFCGDFRIFNQLLRSQPPRGDPVATASGTDFYSVSSLRFGAWFAKIGEPLRLRERLGYAGERM